MDDNLAALRALVEAASDAVSWLDDAPGEAGERLSLRIEAAWAVLARLEEEKKTGAPATAELPVPILLDTRLQSTARDLAEVGPGDPTSAEWTADGLDRLIQDIKLTDKLSTLPNGTLAKLLVEHITFGDQGPPDPRTALIMEVHDRLARLEGLTEEVVAKELEQHYPTRQPDSSEHLTAARAVLALWRGTK